MYNADFLNLYQPNKSILLRSDQYCYFLLISRRFFLIKITTSIIKLQAYHLVNNSDYDIQQASQQNNKVEKIPVVLKIILK